MTSKTTNKFSSEVRARAVRMALDHEGEHASRCAATGAGWLICRKAPRNLLFYPRRTVVLFSIISQGLTLGKAARRTLRRANIEPGG